MATQSDWVAKLAEVNEATLTGLIWLFTLGEMALPGWTAGERSPVPALVRRLKQAGAFDPELSRWIKANTDNKFLPHGNLMDRL